MKPMLCTSRPSSSRRATQDNWTAQYAPLSRGSHNSPSQKPSCAQPCRTCSMNEASEPPPKSEAATQPSKPLAVGPTSRSHPGFMRMMRCWLSAMKIASRLDSNTRAARRRLAWISVWRVMSRNEYTRPTARPWLNCGTVRISSTTPLRNSTMSVLSCVGSRSMAAKRSAYKRASATWSAMKAYTAASSRSTSSWRGRFHSCARRWLNARTPPSSPHTSMPSAAESSVARNSESNVSNSRSVVSWRLRSSMVSSSTLVPLAPQGTRRTQRCTGTRLPSARSKLVWAGTPWAITSAGSDQNASSLGRAGQIQHRPPLHVSGRQPCQTLGACVGLQNVLVCLIQQPHGLLQAIQPSERLQVVHAEASSGPGMTARSKK